MFFRIDFRVTISGNCENLNIYHFLGVVLALTLGRLLGILSLKFIDLRVTKPGDWLISGYCYPEVD